MKRKTLEMTEGEICRLFRMAKNKRAQISILCELNNTYRNIIIDVLYRNGEVNEAGEAHLDKLDKEIKDIANSNKEMTFEELCYEVNNRFEHKWSVKGIKRRVEYNRLENTFPVTKTNDLLREGRYLIRLYEDGRDFKFIQSNFKENFNRDIDLIEMERCLDIAYRNMNKLNYEHVG